MRKHAILLSGPLGVGKTSLGRALAARLGGGFVDGDDHSDAELPWYCSTLRRGHAVVTTGLGLLEAHTFVIIAYPLRCTDWIFYKRRFDDAGVHSIFVNLRASFEEIVAPTRGRKFTNAEQARIGVMIREGYSDRQFGDLTIDTGSQSFDATFQVLASDVMRTIDGA